MTCRPGWGERGSSADGLACELASLARDQLGELEGEAFLARLELAYADIVEPLGLLYGQRTDVVQLVRDLLGVVLHAAAARPKQMRLLDRRREVDPGWFQRPRMVGYACYADRFAGSLAGVRERLDYLAELGVNYLYLMPVLPSREDDNDGGFAVIDYDAVDPRLGTMGDLEALAGDLHDRGMALSLDLVLNHTAKEHPWARKAAAGHPAYRDFYLVFPDRREPDCYERTLPDVFPHIAPGSFTHIPEMGGWVWTTFNHYQWDLNYSNPAVFRAMLSVMLDLANHGVDVVRLDAIPFLWKRMGTDCRNQPEVHLLVQAFRALTRIAAPGLLLKAEAIVQPEMVVQYLGGHDRYRPECDLAYNNQLNIMLWSSLACRDARLATQALSRLRPEPACTSWVTYLRCHDDIGWAVSDADADAVGLTGTAHRRFLNDFFSGRFPGSFARGTLFQHDQRTGDARICGTSAALCGIQAALDAEDDAELEFAVRRLETLYSVVFSFGGIPLLWMGDELALRDDPHWADDPAHAKDNRWLQRPPMDWVAAARRRDPAALEGRVFSLIQRLSQARRSQPALGAGGQTDVLCHDNPHVLAYRRQHPTSSPLLALANFSGGWQSVDAALPAAAGLPDPEHLHSARGRLDWGEGRLHLPPWGFAWLITR
jgi:amylosucrase